MNWLKKPGRNNQFAGMSLSALMSSACSSNQSTVYHIRTMVECVASGCTTDEASAFRRLLENMLGAPSEEFPLGEPHRLRQHHLA